jgi:hypothetical protein
MTDYFIYDRANNTLVRFSTGDIIIYGSEEEAIEDLYGNEEVVQYNDLPKDKRKEILKQITNDKARFHMAL